MANSKSVEHIGRVETIDDNKINVNILAKSGCASCHIKGACSASDMKEKIVEVYDFKNQYIIGEEVNVVLKQSLGFMALFYGYVLPFLLVLFILIVLSVITNNEAISGIGSLAVLVPYYFILFITKDKIKKKFAFTINKI